MSGEQNTLHIVCTLTMAEPTCRLGETSPKRDRLLEQLVRIPSDAVAIIARLEQLILELDRLYRAEDYVGFASLLETTARDLRKGT